MKYNTIRFGRRLKFGFIAAVERCAALCVCARARACVCVRVRRNANTVRPLENHSPVRVHHRGNRLLLLLLTVVVVVVVVIQ